MELCSIFNARKYADGMNKRDNHRNSGTGPQNWAHFLESILALYIVSSIQKQLSIIFQWMEFYNMSSV